MLRTVNGYAINKSSCIGNELSNASSYFFELYTEKRITGFQFSEYVTTAGLFPVLAEEIEKALRAKSRAKVDDNQADLKKAESDLALYHYRMRVALRRERKAAAEEAQRIAAAKKAKLARIASAPAVNVGDLVKIEPDYYSGLISGQRYPFTGYVESVEAPDHITARPTSKTGKPDKRSRTRSYFWTGKVWS